MNSRQQQAKIIRIFRKIHRTTGVFLFVFFFFIAISGILLGWKNNSNGLILPETKTGSTTSLAQWKPIYSLYNNACFILHDSISPNLSIELDRIDIRKEKGIIKFVFKDQNWEVQLDGATNELLQIGKRHSDFIENLHDGSVLDGWFNTSKDQFKLIYTSIMGFALLVFTITGFWLWYGPKKLKRSKKNEQIH
jgi:uncharacterized iron-regulated membrane protein